MKRCFSSASIVLTLSMTFVALGSSQAAVYSPGDGTNSWSFLNREWLVDPAATPGSPGFYAPTGTNGLPVAAGAELRGSFIIDADSPPGSPNIEFPPGLPGNAELTGIFYGLMIDPLSPFITSGGLSPYVYFNAGPTGAGVQVFFDDGTGSNPGTPMDRLSAASGSAITGGITGDLDLGWQAATGAADGQLVMTGLFSTLTASDNFILGVAPGSAPVVFLVTLTGSTTGSAGIGSGFLDLSADLPVGTAEPFVGVDTFGLGRDISFASNVYARDGFGGPDAIHVGAGTVANPYTASADSTDPVTFTFHSVPEPVSVLIWAAGALVGSGIAVVRHKRAA